MNNENARVIKTGEWVTVIPYRKGYYVSVPDNYVYAESSLDFHSPDYHKGYEQAEKDLGWISVKDKLPGPSEWVLACIEQHGHAQCLTLAVYSEETKEWNTDQWEDGEQETYNPDYWMPIPNIIKDTKK